MMVDEHRKMLWPHYLNLMLGFWLLTSPFTLGYLSDFVPDANQLRVMAERGLPSFELRNLLMTWSDVISGILVIVFSVLSADAWRRNPWAQWANAFVGGGCCSRRWCSGPRCPRPMPMARWSARW